MVKHGAKKVKISEQRQITIPEEFYDALNFQHEVIIEFIGKAIVILPNETVNFLEDIEEVDFSVDILRDLVSQGYEGEELIQKFIEIKAEIPKALERIKQEAMERGGVTGDLEENFELLEEEDS
ncbi:hypothetical protein ACFPN4_14205 [Ureibacillus thermophilus]|uniref:SpoVT-AbrB domain-containing protein n=2 Tax=Bacillales TaxID=1385 RepID=A0A8J8GK77_9BACI|nr:MULTISPECIES: hypothetical protein [Bacillales]NSL53293.1 hypothetical protein [Calidifontibacillus erzurumensis]QBK24999.1 hypothetical protein DKZ56_03435 [Ureibacillus thermophilus]